MTIDRTTRITALVLAAGVALTAPTAADAGIVHRVQTAPSPSTGEPIAGGGSWIVNKPSGYYLGRAPVGSTFDNEVTSAAGWHYGRADHINMCGWAMPHALGQNLGTRADSCSSATLGYLSHRRNIGKDFNAPAHKAETGTRVSAPNCPFAYNYFHGTDFAGGANAGHWADAAGSTTAGYVLYRFTTLDGKAVEARDPDHGWGFVPATCAGRPQHVYNDND